MRNVARVSLLFILVSVVSAQQQVGPKLIAHSLHGMPIKFTVSQDPKTGVYTVFRRVPRNTISATFVIAMYGRDKQIILRREATIDKKRLSEPMTVGAVNPQVATILVLASGLRTPTKVWAAAQPISDSLLENVI